MRRRDSRDRRSEGRRDRDRILYSSAFRRLAGITQVAPANDRHPLHNRLTHTLEVAQIGRSLAEDLWREDRNQSAIEKLGGLDPDVVEAACLAHDLGHPPFGHVAEAELDRLVKDEFNVRDGFEGNPQSFRILTRLAMRDPRFEGLNLTRATLCAVLKYPWLRGESGQSARKWGAYASERTEFNWARSLVPDSEARSLEAQLMDWADDVAYAVHDVEDFYRAGLIPLDRLAVDAAERIRVVDAEWERNPALHASYKKEALAQAFDEILRFAPFFESYTGSRNDRAQVRAYTSALVSRYIMAVSLDLDQPRLNIAVDARMEVAMLKGLTWQYVIESRPLLTLRYGHKSLIASLFEVLMEAGSTVRDRRIFPAFYRERLAESDANENVARTVADLISSLTEAQVVAMHHRLTGISMGGSLDPILP